jgi:hypothetical protein
MQLSAALKPSNAFLNAEFVTASSLDIYTVGNASQFATLRDLGSSVGWTTFTCPPASATGRLGLISASYNRWLLADLCLSP